jgi:sec-independent protein translocase protein TatC
MAEQGDAKGKQGKGKGKGDANGFDGLAEGPEGDKPMSFLDHVAELRTRLVRSVLGIFVGFFACFGFADPISDFLRIPIDRAWSAQGLGPRAELQALEIQDPLMVDVRVSAMAAVFLVAPWLFYQLWMFVAPGLYAKEKRFVIPFVIVSVLMFVVGATFAFTVVLPFIYEWMITYAYGEIGPNEVAANLYALAGTHFDLSKASSIANDMQARGIALQLELGNYFKGTTRVLLAFGAVFEFPLLVAFLAKAGVVTEKTLIRFWKISVLIIFIVAALLTPPEPISQLMMAIPMCLLYFISIGVAWAINPAAKAEAEAAKLDAELAADDDE